MASEERTGSDSGDVSRLVRGTRYSLMKTLAAIAGEFGISVAESKAVMIDRDDTTIFVTASSEDLTEASLFGYIKLPNDVARGLPPDFYEIAYEGSRRIDSLDTSVPTKAVFIDKSGRRVAETEVEVEVLAAPDDQVNGKLEVSFECGAAERAVYVRRTIIIFGKCYRVKNGWVIVKTGPIIVIVS